MIDYNQLAEKAKHYGFGDLGVCGIAGFEAQKALVERQPSLKERKQLQFDPRSQYPWATALLVLLWPYAPAPLPSGDCVFIDNYYYASNRAYHAANELADWLIEAGYQAKANVSFPARTSALRARLGIIGHNGMLIHPEYGSRVVIILLATDAISAAEDIKAETGTCLQCGKCVHACPTGAIDNEGMCHPERCLRNHMMEGTVVPLHVREKMELKLLGCDACQRVCPMQPHTVCTSGSNMHLNQLVTLDSSVFRNAIDSLSEQVGRNVARPQRVRAQAAILAGNSRSPAYKDVLREWASSTHEAVRDHALWALSAIEES